jgi:NDP-sugar pyrophosphorylase family protein
MAATSSLMPTVILAGGLATRLKPLTEKIPKALIEVAGKPFLWHQLTLLRRQGVERVIILAGHLGELIENTFGNGASVGLSIEYSFDGPTLLGTGGAIRKALPLLPQRFFVLYGDSYLTCSFSEVQGAFEGSRQPGLMTVFGNSDLFDTSNVEFDGARILKYDKRHRTSTMRHIDYGLGAFERSVFQALPAETKIDLEAVHQDLLKRNLLAAFEVKERFYEIGSVAGLKETDEYLTVSFGTGS